MNVTSRKTAAPARALLVALAVALLALVLVPAAARADEASDAPAYSEDLVGNRTYYATVDDAMKAAYDGAVIVMNRDWQLADTLQVKDNSDVTIDMNGHKIAGNGSSSVIKMRAGSSLTLGSDASQTFSFTGYCHENGGSGTFSVTSGGLVTGGNSNMGGAVYMCGGNSLFLSNVAVAGNHGDYGGGVYTFPGCTVTINRGATITRNGALNGGGIYMYGMDTNEATNVLMDDGSINANYATGKGGGIFSYADATDVRLENNSTISENESNSGGAGIYLAYTHFNVESADRTGSMNKNWSGGDSGGASDGGGAIHVENVAWQDHRGTIVGLNLYKNYSAVHGGAIYIGQAYTYVTDCTLTRNWSEKCGGGIIVGADHCSLTNCTITDNTCDYDGTVYEGGGVFVGCDYDLTLSGKCTIKNNHRNKNGSADDLFLSDGLFGAHAYILGGVDAGSEVGIRTGMTKDQMVGKNITTYSDGTYFMDYGNYGVTHGSDHGGDLWQRVG